VAKATCSIPDCGVIGTIRRGWCDKHYSRWRHHGSPEPLRLPIEQRFRMKVAPPDENGCALWLGSLDKDGYGLFYLHGKITARAHRVAWTFTYGEPPAGLEPDHTCNVRRCVTPDHLEWVTHAENNRRAALRSEACHRGHRWDEQTPFIHPDGSRRCRICKRVRQLRSYYRRKQQVNP